MKKTSIEMLLLLSNIYDRKNLSELNKDLRSLDAEAFDLLLARLEEQKTKILSAFADELEAQLDLSGCEKGWGLLRRFPIYCSRVTSLEFLMQLRGLRDSSCTSAIPWLLQGHQRRRTSLSG